MSTSSSTTTRAESSQKVSGQSQTSQADLFNTTYEYSTEGNLPEDIQRDFEIPIGSSLYTLSLSVETILDNIKPGWERAVEVLEAGEKEPEWNGSIDPDVLDRVLRHIPKNIDELKLIISEDGWYSRVVDPANVCMHEFYIDKTDFESYNVSVEGIVGITLDNLSSAYSSTKNTANIDIEFDGPERKFTVDDGTPIVQSLIDPDCLRQAPDIPNLELPNEIALPGDELRVLLKRLTAFAHGDHVLVSGDDKTEEVTFSVESHSETVHKTYASARDLQHPTAENKSAFKMATPESGETLLSGDYVKNYLTSIRKKDLNDSYTLIFGHEFPIKLRTQFSEKSFSMFMLAPRIQA